MFFVSKEKIPEGVGFQTFDMTHLIWIMAGLALWIFGCVFFRRLSDSMRKLALKVLGIYIFTQEMLKNVVLIILGDFSWAYLPFHLCGINILLIFFDVFKQTRTVRSFLYFFAIPGAMLAFLFPNWTEMPVWNFFHIHSFTIHILLVLYPLLLISTDQAETDLKAALKSLALLVAMAIPVYGLNLLWDTNFMFLMDPETGNPLGLFEELLGSHLWGFPILLPVVMLVMYLPARILRKKREKARALAA